MASNGQLHLNILGCCNGGSNLRSRSAGRCATLQRRGVRPAGESCRVLTRAHMLAGPMNRHTKDTKPMTYTGAAECPLGPLSLAVFGHKHA